MEKQTEKLESLKDLQNVKDQISVVKEVCKGLKSNEGEITNVLQKLVQIYITLPAKHQVKRVLISAFQSLPSQSSDFIVTELSRQLESIHTECLVSMDLRTYIDTVAGLMDNFPLGQKCIDNQCLEILQNVSSILSKFLAENSSTQSSVRQNELMHSCLACIQAGNKILQKSHSTLSSKESEETSSVTTSLIKHNIDILHIDEFLMDCKTTCAINVILLIRLKFPKNSVAKVVEYIFQGANKTGADDSDFTILSRGDNLSCQLSLLYGIMSIMELSELVEMNDGKCLLLDYIFSSLTKISEKGYPNSISKLLTVKCYNMWTSKTCSCLKSEVVSDKQRSLLCGGGQIIEAIMSCVWTVWEDTTDVIRIIAREIFENVLKIHTMASSSDISTDIFLQNLTKKLIFHVSWSSKGKYGMLSNLVQIIGTDLVLQQTSDLSSIILSQMSEHALACHASELYIQLSFKHQKEKPEKWMSMWIDPMLKVLALDNRQQINNVIEYILTKLLKKDKEILPYILKQLSTQSDTSKMSSLVTCLRRARVMGLLDKQLESEDSVNNLIDMSVLQQALCHIDEQVRLDAFAFICESNKTTAVVSAWEVHLIRTFLPWNLNSQSPGFRQLLVSQLKKLLYRMKESETMMLRQMKKMNNTADGQGMNERQSLKQYKDFLSWLTRHLFSCLHPGSSFPRKTTCLTALNLMVDIFGTPSAEGFCVCNEIEGKDFNVLIECLTDTFEDNKVEAYKLLKHLSSLDFMKQTFDSVDGLFETALNLAGSTRPLDSTTAAYMFRIVLLQAEFLPVMTKESKSRSFIMSCGQPSFPEISASQSGRVLHLLTWLMEYLRYQIKMAEQSLMSAACSKPLYPTLHSIRYVIQDVNFKSILTSDIPFWKKIVAELINGCLQISQIVSPVVQNSSPEGNIPVEVMGNITQTTEGLMPEYLTVCCWRSIKEVSLLLGLLCTNVPVKNTGDQDSDGLMTCKQIDEIGSYFKTQLLESIHRGAFELAYAGFVKMCDMLWRSTIPDLYKRPKLWLSHLMGEIQSVSSKLCATRRSAGVPFYVQALVTTEPLTTGRQCFKQAMTDLLKLALTEESHDLSESKVHSLNILRAMYRDTRLGEDVTPFISGGLQAAILGFKSKFWGICNSSTLLFSALMTRVFGVKRSKDESSMSKKNCQTGKAFFHKYPGLYNFILDLLAEATQNVEGHGTVHLHPSLYPLLMVLARLFPSPLEGTDTSLNLSAFIPYILRCSSSAVLKTRQMSAKALQPLVIGSNVVNVLTDLVHRLPVNRDQVHYSQVHGVLLQIHSVVEILPSLESNIRQQSQQILVEEWLKRTWLVSSVSMEFDVTVTPVRGLANYKNRFNALYILTLENACTNLNACHVIKKEALNLTSKLLTEISGDSKPDSNTKRLQHTLFTALAEEQILLTEPYKQAGPGYIEYLTILANLLLYHCSKGDNLKEIRHMGDNLVGYNIKGDNSGGSNMREAIVENSKGDNYLELGYMGDNSIEARLMLILNCCHYEIRMIGLMYVHSVCSDKEEGDDFHVVLECDIPSVDDETVQRTLSSPEVLGKLIQMASDESHFECQKLVFKALTNHPSMQKGSWFKDVIHLIKLFQLCMNFIETCSRDELRSEVIQLTGFLVEPLLKHVSKVKTANDDEVSALLLQWKDMLHYYKGTEQHYLLQVAVIKVLDNNTDLLLKDSTLYWDETTFAFWEILVSLLQEDDQEINEMAAKIVSRLNPKVQVTVHPYLALDLTIGSMLHHHYTRHWKLCVRTMLKWMETDTKEEVGASGRLFDKNEMNTWREDIQFVKIVMKYLIQIILSCNTSSIAGIDNHFSKTENAVTKGDNSTMNNESKGDNLRTDREKLLHLQTELMDKFPVGQKFNLEPITSDQSERWSTILDSLYSHLTLVLKEDLASSGPFKDVNKYIHCSINKLKVDLVIQLCQCLSDSRINSLLQGK